MTVKFDVTDSDEESEPDDMPLKILRKKSIVIKVPKDVVDLGQQTSDDDDHFYHDPNAFFDCNSECKKLISRYQNRIS